MGLKVIDGTPTAISKYLRESEDKIKKIAELKEVIESLDKNELEEINDIALEALRIKS